MSLIKAKPGLLDKIFCINNKIKEKISKIKFNISKDNIKQ